jgi:hypothetical protein
MSKNNSRDALLAADQKLIDGTNKNKSKLPASFPLAKQQTTPADVVTTLDQRITTGKAVVQAEAAHAAAIKADDDVRAQTKKQVAAYKRLLIAMFLEQPDVLADYGLAPPKVGQKTAAVKAEAAAKAKATRAKLGTKGTKQKKAAKAASAAPGQTPPQPAAAAAQPGAPAAQPAASSAQPAAAAKPVS